MIDFRFNNFNFAIAVFFTDPMYEEENLAIDETWKYFDYVLTLREWEGEADITDLVFETRFCTLNDFFNKFTEEQFDFSGIWYMLCPIIDDKSNFTIEGDFTEDYYKYLMGEIKLSEYAKTHMNEFKQAIQDHPIQMATYFMDQAVDYEKKDQPVRTIL